MRRFLPVVLAVSLALLVALPAAADDGDAARLAFDTARIGDRVLLHIQVSTPKGATVDVLPGAPGWNRVEVIETRPGPTRDTGNTELHSIDLVVAPFLSGEVTFAPSVTVADGADVTVRVLPPVTLMVGPVLGADDPLQLSPLPPPGAINGAESPLLRPLIALAGLVAASALLAAGALVVSRLLRKPAFVPELEAAPVPSLAAAETLIRTDPVRAYRQLAAVVRSALSTRYDFPAFALTTLELQRRMETAGVDRWQARLVGGLLEECDAVVYAGYRPVTERCEADLTVAREILEASA